MQDDKQAELRRIEQLCMEQKLGLLTRADKEYLRGYLDRALEELEKRAKSG